MSIKAVVPPDFAAGAEALGVSPGVMSGGHLFLTGVTGSGPDGAMPADPPTQFRAAFDKIGTVLGTAGLGFDALVEMTSYHVELRTHFDVFAAVRREYVAEPYPAWTTVEVAGLRREGALVEVRVIATATG